VSVYVDNMRRPATVGRIRGRWSHLTADTVEELHELAGQIGLKPEWFQARCKYGSCPAVDGVCAHFHYDVVDAKRAEAITCGAKDIDLRELGAITSARRAQFRPPPARDEFRLEIITDPDVPGAVVRFHADGIAAALAQARRLLAAHDGPADTYGELYQRNGNLADFLATVHQGA
jgi:hypothetical protein